VTNLGVRREPCRLLLSAVPGSLREPDEDQPRIHDSSDERRDQRRNEEVDPVRDPRIRITAAMTSSEHVTVVGLIASRRRPIALPL